MLIILSYFSGPAPDYVTAEIFNITVGLESYNIVPDLECDIDTQGVYTYIVSLKQINQLSTRAFQKITAN